MLRKYSSREMAGIVISLIYQLFRYMLLVAISYVVLFPVLKIVSTALTLPKEYLGGNVSWIPSEPTFINFKNSLSYFKYFKHAWITIQIAGISTAIQLVVCSLVGYGLARCKFKGRNLVFMAVIFTIIMPIQTAQIPSYLYYRNFDFIGIGSLIGLVTGTPFTVNLLDTNWSYYVPAMFGVGLNSGLFIFLFRQYFSGMPKDLEDAGKVDGCNPFMIFLRIMVPNVKPVFVTVALLSCIYYWNDSLVSGMFMISADSVPLMTALKGLLKMDVSRLGLEAAQYRVELNAILLMVIAPLMIVFIICQKSFIECMDRSGIKG